MGQKRKTSPDDKDARGRRIGQRGARRGQTTSPQPHGGSIGQKPYVPDERDREYVLRNHFYLGSTRTAARLGISEATLERHFRDEIKRSAEELLIAGGKTAMQKALQGDGPMLRYVLATRFPDLWSPKYRHEHTGPNGAPIEFDKVDSALMPLLEGKTTDELRELERIFDALIAAGGIALGPEGDPAGQIPDPVPPTGG